MIPQAKQILSLTTQAVSSTQQLRTTVTNVFEFLRDGMNGDDGSNQTRSQFLQKFQELLQAVNKDFTDLEKLGNSLTSMPELSTAPLGPAGQLSMEGNADDNSLYQNTLLTYQWYTKLHNRAQIAQNTFHTYKRPLSTSAVSLAKARRGFIANIPQSTKPHNVSPQHVDTFLNNMLPRQYTDLSVKVISSVGTTRIVHITVERVFYALILFKNLLVERIMIRGLDEDVFQESGHPDMFTQSRYECMRLITNHATSASLYIEKLSQLQIDLKPRFILAWLQDYKTLFTDSCHKCGKILNNNLPPTWRDFKTHVPYHSTCK